MPGWFTRWSLRLRATLSGRHDRELRDELQLHLHLLEEEYIAQGMAPETARQRASREFGNATRFQEASHDLFAFRLLEDFVKDVRFALHEARRSPAFTCIAVLSLAVGIGAVTAAFTIVDAFMLRNLPVRAPDRLVAFSTSGSTTWGTWPYASFQRWRQSADALFEVAAASDVDAHPVVLGGAATPNEIRVTLVSANYFHVMGVGIVRGRSFVGSDDAASGAAAVAIISDAFWERWFGRAPDVLGKTMALHGTSYEVVGVAPKGFTGHAVAQPSDLWVPLTMQAALMPGAPDLLGDGSRAAAPWLKVIGRLQDGVTLEQAAVSANLIRSRFVAEQAVRLGESSPEVARARKQSVFLLTATTGFAPERERYARPLMILSVITALVLLVACANFANLMLARSEGRRREFAIRVALGGGMWRLVRQLATESVVLAAAAGLLALLFAEWATALALTQFARMKFPVELALRVDARVPIFVIACVTVVAAFGLWPSTRALRSAVLPSSSQWARPTGPRHGLGWRLMLIAQLAMCTVLLIGAGLLLRTVINLRSQNLGFDRNVLLVSMSPGQGAQAGGAELQLERVRERLLAVPGVQAAGFSGVPLLDPFTYWIDGTQQLTTDGGAALPGVRWTFAAVGAGFFDAVGMSIVDGRGFEAGAAGQRRDAVVVNRTLATFLFGETSAVGRSIRMGPRGPLQPIVGVVNDAKQVSPREGVLGVVYLPMRDFNRVVLAVRTAADPADSVAAVQHQLTAIAGDLPLGTVRTISEVLDEAIAQERLMSGISLVLSAVAIAIGCVGLYALMSSVVARRRHELGIRLALGATSTKVVTMVLRDSAALVVPGLALGIPLGIAASQPLSAQLFGVRANDPSTVALVVLLLTAVGLLATLKPAHTASRIDPLELLRNE